MGDAPVASGSGVTSCGLRTSDEEAVPPEETRSTTGCDSVAVRENQ